MTLLTYVPYEWNRNLSQYGFENVSYATVPLNDSDKCLRMCFVRLEREFYPSQRIVSSGQLIYSPSLLLQREVLCRPVNQRSANKVTCIVFNALFSLYPTSVP